MKINVNGMTISIEDAPVTIGTSALDYDFSKESMELDNLSKDIDKSIEAFKIISDVKAMESFGYKATEGVGQAIAKGAKVVWEKIKEFFVKLVNFFKDLFTKISDFIKGRYSEKIDKEFSTLLESGKLDNIDDIIIGVTINLKCNFPTANHILKVASSNLLDELDKRIVEIGRFNKVKQLMDQGVQDTVMKIYDEFGGLESKYDLNLYPVENLEQYFGVLPNKAVLKQLSENTKIANNVRTRALQTVKGCLAAITMTTEVTKECEKLEEDPNNIKSLLKIMGAGYSKSFKMVMSVDNAMKSFLKVEKAIIAASKSTNKTE